MKFSYFPSVKSQKGFVLDNNVFNGIVTSKEIYDLANKIAREEDPDKRGNLKKSLPIVTWQAYFPGKRLNAEAQPSGLFMLDIDHVDNPFKLYESFCSRIPELGILLVHKTPSLHGLRIVAKCRKEFSSIAECQQWLSREIGLPEFDEACKDWARSSFLVPQDYILFQDGHIFTDEPEEGTVYDVKAPAKIRQSRDVFSPSESGGQAVVLNEQGDVDQREGLFGGPADYKGIPYEEIIKEWFARKGGEPVPGDRNTKLYQLASRLRYICDFSTSTLLRIMPRYDLPEEEIKEIVHHACSAARASDMPSDLKNVINSLAVRRKLLDTPESEAMPEVTTVVDTIPSLPPVFRQYAEIAPDDFKNAVILAQLPILGTLGSRLRAKYLDGKMHSPSFLVSLEAPQASGKSFLGKLVEEELGHIIEHDEQERAKEREYASRISDIKMMNIKIKPENKDEYIGQRPQSIIRYVPATMSITKMLMRTESARGLHLFAFAPEIDTVLKAFKRGFSSLSDALRMAFDNDLYGQDYASDNSFSGNVKLYYNTLYSGTPRAMCRFYPDVEDGLVSRVLFVTLPDQFGKPMPVWGVFTPRQQATVNLHLTRLNEITIQGDEVQPEHVMKLDFVCSELEKWIREQQAQAVKENDRTRDIFCRRAAVVGFRAAMLCFFLWGERNTPQIRRNTIAFALYVANSMLTQHLLRFKVNSTHSNTNRWEDIYNALPQQFLRSDLEALLQERGIETPSRNVIYRWRLLNTLTSSTVDGVETFEKIKGQPEMKKNKSKK